MNFSIKNNHLDHGHSEMPASDTLHGRLHVHQVRQIHNEHQQQDEAGAPVLQELHIGQDCRTFAATVLQYKLACESGWGQNVVALFDMEIIDSAKETATNVTRVNHSDYVQLFTIPSPTPVILNLINSRQFLFFFFK